MSFSAPALIFGGQVSVFTWRVHSGLRKKREAHRKISVRFVHMLFADSQRDPQYIIYLSILGRVQFFKVPVDSNSSRFSLRLFVDFVMEDRKLLIFYVNFMRGRPLYSSNDKGLKNINYLASAEREESIRISSLSDTVRGIEITD